MMEHVVVRRVAVVGAASQIGQALLPRLAAKRIPVLRIGREDAGLEAESADAVISLAPLPAIAAVLKKAEVLGAKRVIAFGSTGRFSKRGSSSAIERDFVAQQEHAESLFSSQSNAAGIAWTLFRPTMIYGADADQNVTFIKAMVARFGFFPVPWGAKGLRQPVHVGDLADACVSALECGRTFGRAYDLGGGEVLSFPERVRRISLAAGKRPVLLPVPMALYYLVVAAAKRYPATAFVREEMVERMFQDLTADNLPAFDAFGYSPRRFSPEQSVAIRGGQ